MPARTALRRIARRVGGLLRFGRMPRRIARQVAALGPVIDTRATARFFALLHETEPYAGVHIARDLAYGPHARNRLDVFARAQHAAAPRSSLVPVLMFIHGGGFFGGDRRSPDADSPFYDNVMLLAARGGLVGVNATYRLVPEHPWPAGAEDVAAAVRWVHESVAGYGGDPTRIVLIGHSAGATHVATYLAHRQFHGLQGPGVRGAILISGLYDLADRALFDGERAYFGDDPARYAERAALPGLVEAGVPLMVVHADLDPPVFHDQARRLTAALAEAGRPARAVVLAEHNHLSAVFALNTADASFSSEIAAFLSEAMRRLDSPGPL
jgi:triacylglycerol lipase